MPNVAQVLKEEIARVARKEIRSAIGRIAKPTSKARHTQAALKRRIAVLEKQAKQIQAMAARLGAAQPPPTPDKAGKIRVTAKGMRSLRKKLRLTPGEFGKLIGVTRQAVANWEKGEGALKIRETTRASLMAIRGIGAREAKVRLAEKPGKAKVAKNTKKVKNRATDGDMPHGHLRARRGFSRKQPANRARRGKLK